MKETVFYSDDDSLTSNVRLTRVVHSVMLTLLLCLGQQPRRREKNEMLDHLLRLQLRSQAWRLVLLLLNLTLDKKNRWPLTHYSCKKNHFHSSDQT